MASETSAVPSRKAAVRRRTLIGWLFILPTVVVFGIFTIYPIILSIPLAFFQRVVAARAYLRRVDALRAPLARRELLERNEKLASLPRRGAAPATPVNYAGSTLKPKVARYSGLPGDVLHPRRHFDGGGGHHLEMALPRPGLINSFTGDHRRNSPARPHRLSDRPEHRLWSVMAVTLWKGLGYYMIIYLAGLQSVPTELGEAAQIDGANRVQNLWFITIPLLRPYVLLCSLLSTIAALRVFDEVWVMTRGGPIDSTMVANAYLYRTGFEQLDFGYAAAVGLALGVVVLTASIGVFIFNRRGGLNYY